jgi:hypothetical protein
MNGAMPESVKFVLATSAVECAGAVLMTVVVLRLYRVYNRTYLRHMALSWAALAVYFFASAIALAAAITGVAASSPTRLAASMISLVAGYWQVAWLVIGTTEVGYGGWITRRKELYVLAVCAAIAIVTPLFYVTDPAASTQRLFLRFGIKSFVTGLVFVAVGIAVHRARRGKFLGRGMVTFAFVAYGLQALRAEGVQIAVDDFGTGFSSLSHLRAFPVDLVKMDRSFVRMLDAQPPDTALAAGTLSLAHALGLAVVAEGVETETQRETLIALGCDFGQGFLFGTPLQAEDCERLLFGDHEVAGTSDAG